ncbi:hypothetical protein B0T19DRAFT_421601 [Cercophora scortea]|uniref:Uncharacterized protein n=1 Tax=Cercophora scortea TaxID=314031 RepID=A0AAE0ILU2_9PEZI|nr:hypothetical protein B0T19DRAFT_421601 [Cercophora scortea]
MGTRHLICIFWRGKWVLAQYGQFDGYPEYQGVRIFRFLSVARNIERLKAGLENHVYEPSEEELDAIYAEIDAWNESNQTQAFVPGHEGTDALYPSLSRKTSAKILGIIARAAPGEAGGDSSGLGDEDDDDDDNDINHGPESSTGAPAGGKKKIPLRLELDFANNGLYCEWVYVIDLDSEVLEVFGGSEAKHAHHRFKDIGGEDASVPAFISAFPFSDIFLMTDGDDFVGRVAKALKEQRHARGETDDDDDDWDETQEAAPSGDMDVDEQHEGQTVEAAGHQDANMA